MQGIRAQQSHKTLQGRRGVGRDARAVRCRHPRPVAVELAARQRASGHDVVMPVDVCEPLVLCRQQAWGGATLCSQQREDAHCRASFFAPPPPSPALLRSPVQVQEPRRNSVTLCSTSLLVVPKIPRAFFPGLKVRVQNRTAVGILASSLKPSQSQCQSPSRQPTLLAQWGEKKDASASAEALDGHARGPPERRQRWR